MCGKVVSILDINTDELSKQVLANKNKKQYGELENHTFNEDSDYPDTPEGKELIHAVNAELNQICESMTTWEAWGHVLAPGESTAPHAHVAEYPFGLSWVYYCDVEETSGDLVFLSRFDSKQIRNIVTPKKNMLVIFPDYIMHYTLKNKSNKYRISISGNAKPNFEILNKDQSKFGSLFNLIGVESQKWKNTDIL